MLRHNSRTHITSVLAVFVGITQLVAQQSGAPPQAPAFRSGVEVVAVDFLAVDSQGRPLPDLKPNELTLKIDGKTREIRSLQFVRTRKTNAPAHSIPAVSVLPPPFADNQDVDSVDVPSESSRSVFFVVDHEHLKPGTSRAVPEIVDRFLNLLSSGDRAGMVTMPNGRVEVNLTTDLDRVRRTAANVSGLTPPPPGDFNLGVSEAIEVSRSTEPQNDPIVQEVADAVCRLNRDQAYVDCMNRTTVTVTQQALRMARDAEISTQALMMSVVDFLGSLAAIGGPKTLVFISDGFAPFPGTFEDMRAVTVAAGRSSVQVYAIQPHTASTQDASRTRTAKSYGQDQNLQLSGLQDLAAATGGSVLRLTGTAESAVARIELETSAHYLLGFEPTPGERDGKSHTIDVRVQRAGVAVRARPEFTIPRPRPAARVSDTSASSPSAPATADLMIRDDKTYRDLPMRALAYPFRSADKTSIKVVVIVESLEPSTQFSALSFSLADSGKALNEWKADTAQLSARPLVSATVVPAGNYHLRVAATDARGRAGAVNYDFSAELSPAGPLHLGAMMLGVKSPSGAFTPRLLFGARDDEIAGYFEVYGANVARGATVAWELAASADGPALATAAGELAATADPDRFIALGGLPIVSLAPGDYVLRANLSINGEVVGRLSRVLRKQ